MTEANDPTPLICGGLVFVMALALLNDYVRAYREHQKKGDNKKP